MMYLYTYICIHIHIHKYVGELFIVSLDKDLSLFSTIRPEIMFENLC